MEHFEPFGGAQVPAACLDAGSEDSLMKGMGECGRCPISKLKFLDSPMGFGMSGVGQWHVSQVGLRLNE